MQCLEGMSPVLSGAGGSPAAFQAADVAGFSLGERNLPVNVTLLGSVASVIH